MKDYQERVVEEKKELDDKIERLDIFLKMYDKEGLVGVDLSDEEEVLMKIQLTSMITYSMTLTRRIQIFHEKEVVDKMVGKDK
jgi:hypothetical protein